LPLGTLMRRPEWHFPRMRPRVAQRPHTQRLRFEMRRKRSCRHVLTLPLLLPTENGQVGLEWVFTLRRGLRPLLWLWLHQAQRIRWHLRLWQRPPAHSFVHIACRLPWQRLITAIRLADFAPPSFLIVRANTGALKLLADVLDAVVRTNTDTLALHALVPLPSLLAHARTAIIGADARGRPLCRWLRRAVIRLGGRLCAAVHRSPRALLSFALSPATPLCPCCPGVPAGCVMNRNVPPYLKPWESSESIPPRGFGIVALCSLRVREVPGSIPGIPQLRLGPGHLQGCGS
jgi:hypothetical protein